MENFTNNELDATHLPKIELLTFNPLHSKYLYETLLGRLLFLFPLIGGYFLAEQKNIPLILEIFSALGIVLILVLIFGYLGFFKKGWALRDKDISYRQGLFIHSITTVPLNRIQHTEVVRGPLDRLFGLASIKIYTAGGSSSDITVMGLPTETAEQLREFINSKIRKNEFE